MVRFLVALLLFVSLPLAWPQAFSHEEEVRESSEESVDDRGELPEAPSAVWNESPSSASNAGRIYFYGLEPSEGFPATRKDAAEAFSIATFESQSRTGRALSLEGTIASVFCLQCVGGWRADHDSGPA